MADEHSNERVGVGSDAGKGFPDSTAKRISDFTASEYLMLARTNPGAAAVIASLRRDPSFIQPDEKIVALYEQYGPAALALLDAAKRTFSPPDIFDVDDDDTSHKTSYSPEFENAGSYFRKDEIEIDSFDQLNSRITTLIKTNPHLDLVWRGARDSTWGMHSHLFRHLMDVNGVIGPRRGAQNQDHYPTEDQMVLAEAEILRIARTEWRLDDLSALEIFAKLQHYGAPTRLIDVTRNPYIGAWFAVEHHPDHDNIDGRLFALATVPVSNEGVPPATPEVIQLDGSGTARDPFWHRYLNREERRIADWGTGSKRRIWVPPSYDQRIISQNAAFILDGVPMPLNQETASYFKQGEKGKYWRTADLNASGSVLIKTSKPSRPAVHNKWNFAPTFSFRITVKGKQDIRQVLENRFGYRHSTIYPDIAALASYLSSHLRVERPPLTGMDHDE